MIIPASPLVKYGWLRALIFIPIWFILTVGFSLLGDKINVTLFGSPSSAKPLDGVSEIIPLIAQIIAVLLSIFICQKWIDRRDLSLLGLQPKWKEFIWGGLFGITLITIGTVLMDAVGWIELQKGVFNIKSVLTFLLMFMLVSINEEVLCRTYFLTNLMASMNKFIALLIVALIFGVLHIFNPDFTWFSFAEISLAGILLGFWYIYRKNIWFPIGLHFTWNYFQGVVYGFEVSGQRLSNTLLKQIDIAEPLLSGGSFGIEGSVMGMAVTVLGCIALYGYLQKTDNTI